mgnify:CR=1 FL=1
MLIIDGNSVYEIDEEAQKAIIYNYQSMSEDGRAGFIEFSYKVRTISPAKCQKNGSINPYFVTIPAWIILAVRVFLFIYIKIVLINYSFIFSTKCFADVWIRCFNFIIY